MGKVCMLISDLAVLSDTVAGSLQGTDLNGTRLEEGVDYVLVPGVHPLMQISNALFHNVPQPGFPHTLHQCFYVTQLGLHKANQLVRE